MVDLKQLARRVFRETLSAIDVSAAMQRKLRRSGTLLHCNSTKINLKDFSKVYVVAIGKAAHAMVGGLVQVLTLEAPLHGVVSAPTTASDPVQGVRYFAAGHPVPNGESWKAAEAILTLLSQCDSRTLVFFLLSGGGSALVELPLDPEQKLEDVQELHRALVTCGAPISAINTVRKHFSAVKGGRLAVASGQAMKVTLAVSDVPAGRDSAIASGPTLPDPTTISSAMQVIADFSLRDRFTPAIRRWVDDGKMPETPKDSDTAFAKADFSLLLGMDDLFHPAHRAAEGEGCITACDNATDDWPVEKAAENLLGQLEELRRVNPGRPVALIVDGELSSPVIGKGIGGRNSSFVLACVEKIAGKNIAVLSAGTDGIDGNSPAAGAVADGETLARARVMGLDPKEAMRQSDAYTFFARLDDAIITGPTGNNLRDLRILIAGP